MLVEKLRGAQRLTAVDRQAAGLGLAPGLTLAEARARVHPLVAAEANPAADADFLLRLALLCERFTPLVALSPPEGLVLDITGCAVLFGTEGRLRQTLLRRLTALGLSVQDGLAGTPDAARALARFGTADVSEALQIARLPVQALEATAATAQALMRSGLKTVGDLADRPSAALTARFGAALTTRLARLLGQEDTRIVPLRPPAACTVERHFLEPLVQAQALEGVLGELMRELATLLEQRGIGGRSFEASLFRSDGQVRRILVETGRPSRDVATLLRLFALRIATLNEPIDAGFGIDVVRLAVTGTDRLAPAQPGLDGQITESAEIDALIDRLATRFGRDRVLRFVTQDTHHPERAFQAVPAQQMPDAATRFRLLTTGPPTRPLRLFDPPQPIETLAEVPDGAPLRFRWRRVLHEVIHAEGPERIAPEWWRDGPQAPTRDYYRLEDAAGRRFWVFRAGLHNSGSAPPWFMHALFA